MSVPEVSSTPPWLPALPGPSPQLSLQGHPSSTSLTWQPPCLQTVPLSGQPPLRRLLWLPMPMESARPSFLRSLPQPLPVWWSFSSKLCPTPAAQPAPLQTLPLPTLAVSCSSAWPSVLRLSVLWPGLSVPQASMCAVLGAGGLPGPRGRLGWSRAPPTSLLHAPVSPGAWGSGLKDRRLGSGLALVENGLVGRRGGQGQTSLTSQFPWGPWKAGSSAGLAPLPGCRGRAGQLSSALTPGAQGMRWPWRLRAEQTGTLGFCTEWFSRCAVGRVDREAGRQRVQAGVAGLGGRGVHGCWRGTH